MAKRDKDGYEEPLIDEDEERQNAIKFKESMEEYERSRKTADEIMEIYNIETEVLRKMIAKKKENIYNLKMTLGILNESNRYEKILKNLHNEESELRKEIYNIEDAKNPLHYFITIRPRENSIKFEEFYKNVKNIFKKKWITDYVYVIEQTGITEETLGTGFHIHIIIRRNEKRPSEIIREIKSTVKGMGEVDNHNFLDIKGIYNNENDLKNRLNYILGEKKSTEGNQKDLKQKIDIIFRQTLNLEKYYSFGEFFSPYITEVLSNAV